MKPKVKITKYELRTLALLEQESKQDWIDKVSMFLFGGKSCMPSELKGF